MSRPTIVEQNFFEFKAALRASTDAGTRIEMAEKDRWKAWVREHKIQEAAFRSMAAQKFDEPVAVIIDDDSDWSGYYLYTPTEEICLRWTPGS